MVMAFLSISLAYLLDRRKQLKMAAWREKQVKVNRENSLWKDHDPEYIIWSFSADEDPFGL